MKWTIETEDPHEIQMYMQADKMHSALVEVAEWLRAKEKYMDTEFAAELRQKYHEILREWEVVL